MRRSIVKPLVYTAVGIVAFFGCNTVLEVPDDGAAQTLPTTDGDSGLVESEFTDDDVSPGGTDGGTPDEPLEGADDVELPAEETRSFFTAFQIDPVEEDTAGPKFVISADIDQDGLLDLVSAWNQSQPVQLHLQRRDPDGNISFRTITLAGTTPVAVVAGLEVGQINDDGWLDIVILSKATGFVTLCPTNPPQVISGLDGEIIVLFSPGDAGLIPDGDRWSEMILVNPYVQDRWIHDQFPGIEFKDFEESKTKPEWSGYTSLEVANIDGMPGDDIIVALNAGECEQLGQKPPVNTVDLWVNPGPGLAEVSEAWGAAPPGRLTRGIPVVLMRDAPQVKEIEVLDVDGDGDLDVIATWTNSISRNIRWVRNPLVPHQTGGPSGRAAVIAGFDEGGPDFCTGGVNDEGPCPGGDADCLGVAAGSCNGGTCVGGIADGQSCSGVSECPGVEDGECTVASWRFIASEWEHRPIGQVDTGADMITVGDLDMDGSVDILMRSTVGQVIQWFRQPNPLVVPPEFPPNDPVPDRFNFPWQVFTLTEFNGQEPEAISIGDVTGNGNNEVIVAVEGGVFWYEVPEGGSPFDPWTPNAIIQDGPVDSTDPAQGAGGEIPGVPGSGVGVSAVDTSTHINTLLVVDLDGDGKNDIVGTLDRRTRAGLSDDRLVWYRNVRTTD